MKETARIYNLFPRLLGKMPNWYGHFPRIASMHFNWVFINPIQYTGFSGSLYAIKDYYGLNPLFYDSSTGESEEEQLRNMLKEAHNNGLSVMLDFVINHTAIDHPFTKSHKEWYKHKDGEIVRPGAWDDGKWVSWGDLGEIDNESSMDRDNLWDYWRSLALYYLSLGFDGFRCDAAYKVPIDFWEYLIDNCKSSYPSSMWFAESLGCPVEDTISLGKAGFDYTFNSVKWWDYEADWCLSQRNANSSYSYSISFPESHDTERLFCETNGNVLLVKQKYFFSSIFSSGIMIPLGFEFGFKGRLDVVKTMPSDYEKGNHDFSSYIRRVNLLKKELGFLSEEGKIHNLKTLASKNMTVLLKRTDKARLLIFVNRNLKGKEELYINDMVPPFNTNNENLRELSSISLKEEDSNHSTKDNIILEPGEIKLLYTTNTK